MKRISGWTAIETLIVIAIIGILIACAYGPYFEAQTFNKFSDKKITYWDALFGDFRIIAEPNK